MKVAWTLQVTAGVTVSSVATAPSRASAESRGIKKKQGAVALNPTTIIASTGFNVAPPRRIIHSGFARQPDRNKRETTCQTGKQSGTLSSEIGVRVAVGGVPMIADRFAGIRRPTEQNKRAPGEGECHA